MSIITRNQKKVLKKISNITKRSIANLAKDAGIEDFFEVDELSFNEAKQIINVHSGFLNLKKEDI